jgi:hypothetical protein
MGVTSKAELGVPLEHQDGFLLRITASGKNAVRIAVGLLDFLEADVEAERSSADQQPSYKLGVAESVYLRLEALEVELSTDGRKVELRRVGGSENDFNDLCELIISDFLRV